MDRHGGGLEDGGQFGGFFFEDLSSVFLAGAGQHLLEHRPGPVGFGARGGGSAVADVVDAEVTATDSATR